MISRNSDRKGEAKALIERVKEATIPAGHDLENVATFNLAQLSFYEKIPSKSLPLYYSIKAAVETDPRLDGLIPTADIPQKVAHCLVYKKDFKAAMREFAYVAEANPASVTAACNLALTTLGAVLQEFRDDRLSQVETIEAAEGQLQTAHDSLMRVKGELEASLSKDISHSRKKQTESTVASIEKYLTRCTDIQKLLAEEKVSVDSEKKQEQETRVTFESSRQNVSTWKEMQVREEEQKRRAEQQAKEARMQRQEEHLRQLDEGFTQTFADNPVDAIETSKRTSKAARARDTTVSQDMPSFPMPEADTTAGVAERIGDGNDQSTLLNTGVPMVNEVSATGRKRIRKEIDPKLRREIDRADEESDETDSMQDDEQEDDEAVGSDFGQDSDGEGGEKKKSKSAKEKKAKKSKKDKKGKKDKKEKKDKKDKKRKRDEQAEAEAAEAAAMEELAAFDTMETEGAAVKEEVNEPAEAPPVVKRRRPGLVDSDDDE
eukprot:TRINITY_DN19310_c0_g1_i1.p1 TRINITY_DN19310_c0_g1~~TRINITY_DN19310_c0_g1_i1.p1  ORF type:complete len:524 (+),score=267.41 TRINITY_DN19310_c0_g1_i1:104-1573(+)